ncbi:MAG: hypothetical protein K0U98_26445 [Deltaproteobacteria bacterium]|nr:hypothetical protein [Deltaproteobacteria bacterium]
MSVNPALEAQLALARAVLLVRAIDFEPYEVSDREKLRLQLLPEISNFLERAAKALMLVEDLAENTEAFSSCPKPVSQGFIEELSDLCFVVSSEVFARTSDLDQLGEKALPWTMLVAAERASIEVTRGLCVIEKELSLVTQVDSQLEQVDLLDDSIRSRVAVAKFRRAVCRDLSGPVAPVLRSAGTSLARLIGRNEFRHLFVSDRISARELHSRAATLLRDPSSEEQDLRRVLEDIRAFAILLEEVNQREELIVHDSAVILRSIEELTPLDQHGAVPNSTTRTLHSIFGRDQDLDQLLISGADVGTVLARLLLLHQLLGLRGGAAAPLGKDPFVSELQESMGR